MRFFAAPSELPCTGRLLPARWARGPLSPHPGGPEPGPVTSQHAQSGDSSPGLCVPPRPRPHYDGTSGRTVLWGPSSSWGLQSQGMCWSQLRPSLEIGVRFSHALIQAPVSCPGLSGRMGACTGERTVTGQGSPPWHQDRLSPASCHHPAPIGSNPSTFAPALCPRPTLTYFSSLWTCLLTTLL